MVGTYLILQNANAEEAYREVSGWITAGQAFGYVLVFWAVISLIRAPFKVIRNDRKKGAWHGHKRIYFMPKLVAAVPWTVKQNGMAVAVTFEDAEPYSLVDYSVELYPPVKDGASVYLEAEPGLLDGIMGSIRYGGTDESAKADGLGRVGLIGLKAYLRVTLDKGTVPVVARVYMHSFEIREKRRGRPHEWTI